MKIWTLMLTMWVACAPHAPLAADDAAGREITAYRVAEPPVVDGFVADDAWQTGEPLERFHQLGAEAEPAKLPSMVVMVYDHAHLYIAMVMGKAPGADMSESFWRDGIELFIDPGQTGDHYFQIAGNHRGTWSAEHPADGSADTGWEPGKQWAARALAGGWLVEAAIPFEAIGVTPEEGDVWGVNVTRSDTHAGYMTLAPLTRSFHEPEAFYALRFGGEREAQAISSDNGNRTTFKELITRLAEQVDSLPANSPGKTQIRDHIESAQATATAIERELREHLVFADVYEQWAYGFMLSELNDDVRWRLRTAELFVRDAAESTEQ